MRTELNKKRQVALEKLARLFDRDIDYLESLMTRDRDPLPSPPEVEPYDHCVFTRKYLETLIEWADRESRSRTSEPRADVDPSVLQQKARAMMGDMHSYDDVEHFPAGYFLG